MIVKRMSSRVTIAGRPGSDRRCAPTSARSIAAGLTALVALTGVSFAQTPPRTESRTAQNSTNSGVFQFDRDTLGPNNPRRDTPKGDCEITVRNASSSGQGLLALDGPCLAGRQITAVLKTPPAFGGSLAFSVRLNEQGAGRISVPLLDLVNAVELQFPDGKRESVSIVFAEAKAAARIMLLWEGPANLDLTVVEPGARLGDLAGVASAEKPSTETDSRSRGVIRWDDPGGSAAWHHESYQVKPEHLAWSKGRIFRWHVSRRASLSAQSDCRGRPAGASASPEVTFMVATLSGGLWSGLGKQYRIEALPCDASDADRRRSVQGDSRF